MLPAAGVLRGGEFLFRLTSPVFHHWLVMTPAGPVDWDGSRPIILDGDTRYLIAVGAVVDGHCGTFDTERRVLTPLRV